MLGANRELHLLVVGERIKRHPGKVAFLVERIEGHLKVWQTLAVEESLLDGFRLNPAERFHRGVLRVLSLPHHLDDQKGTETIEVGLAAAGGAGGADFVVDPKARAEN